MARENGSTLKLGDRILRWRFLRLSGQFRNFLRQFFLLRWKWRCAGHQPTGEMGVLGASVPGLEGEGTSTSGPCGGVSLGASLG